VLNSLSGKKQLPERAERVVNLLFSFLVLAARAPMFLKFFQAISSDLFEGVRFSVELICLSREKHIPFPSLTFSSSCARVVREKKADNFPLHRADTPDAAALLWLLFRVHINEMSS
jgi:hypothetical protein